MGDAAAMSYVYSHLQQEDTEQATHNLPDTSSTMIRDWRKQLKAPPTYRIGNSRIRIHLHIALLIVCFGALVCIFVGLRPNSQSSYSNKRRWNYETLPSKPSSAYNYTYPLSSSIVNNGIVTFRIGLIADLDKESKHPTKANTWRSYLKKGLLSYSPSKNSIALTFSDNDPATEIASGYSLKGRGMELSELVTYNGHILTFDDRTGLVFQLLDQSKVIPWILLMDGAGNTGKGFKSEWATVKDEVLYVGSMGKEWTTADGEFESYDPMFVKAVKMSGEVHHMNWVDNYKAIRKAIGIDWPGYMIHESAAWSVYHRKWFFLPRRCSKERYNETRDESMGCNMLITADEYFRKVETVKLGPFKPTQGFSSFKFVPTSEDNVIVALLTEEINGKTATYYTAFTIQGNTITEPTKINTDLKYEGIDFF